MPKWRYNIRMNTRILGLLWGKFKDSMPMPSASVSTIAFLSLIASHASSKWNSNDGKKVFIMKTAQLRWPIKLIIQTHLECFYFSLGIWWYSVPDCHDEQDCDKNGSQIVTWNVQFKEMHFLYYKLGFSSVLRATLLRWMSCCCHVHGNHFSVSDAIPQTPHCCCSYWAKYSAKVKNQFNVDHSLANRNCSGQLLLEIIMAFSK